MTKQEQTEKIMCMFNKLKKGDYCVDNCYGCCGDEKIDITCHDVVVNFIQALMQAGYGDISEYKAEREMLGSQIKELKQCLNNKCVEVYNLNRDYCNAFERLKSQQREIDGLKAENACLLKACEEKFTFDTTQNKKYSIFNSVRKDFAERLKERFTQYNNTDDVDIIASVNYELNELLKEYEK